MINTDLSVPTSYDTLAYDSDLNPTLRGVIINAPGDLFIIDITDNPVHLTYTAYDPTATGPTAHATFPARLDMQIKRIVGNGAGAAGDGATGTDIALADLVGLV